MRDSLHRTSLALIVALLLTASGTAFGQQTARELDEVVTRPTPGAGAVDIVFCLDVSGSMKPLLDEVRARLWEVVNEFARMSPSPTVRVGLLTYGAASGRDRGWIVKHTDLTRDLDVVYDAMMTFETKGSNEYVGWVLHEAVTAIDWSEDPDALKVILIAGNEAADQASERYDFRTVIGDALTDDIVVHALYAGTREQAVEHRWNEIAEWGEGLFAAVRPSPNVVKIATTHDETLADLNRRLNATYVPYGPRGREAADRVTRRDEFAAGMGAQSLGSRAATKASPLYRQPTWDLVDALDDPTFDLAAVPPEDLPPAAQSMSFDELTIFLDGRRAERDEVRRRILETDERRRGELETRLSRGSDGVVDAMRRAVRAQAESRGFNREADR